MRRFLVFSVEVLTFLFFTGCSDDINILSRCKSEFKDETFSRWQCINAEEEKRRLRDAELLAEEKRENTRAAKESAARPCLGADVSRMEGVASSAAGLIHDTMGPEQVKKILSVTGVSDIAEVIPKDNIKETVLVGYIRTNCHYDYRVLVNVRFVNAESQKNLALKKIRWLRFFPENSPDGYSFPWLLDKEFEQDEERRLRRKFEKELKASSDRYQKKLPQAFSEQGSASEENSKDYCAPGISKSERLKRLARVGKIKQTGSDEYGVEPTYLHYIMFYGEELVGCR